MTEWNNVEIEPPGTVVAGTWVRYPEGKVDHELSGDEVGRRSVLGMSLTSVPQFPFTGDLGYTGRRFGTTLVTPGTLRGGFVRNSGVDSGRGRRGGLVPLTVGTKYVRNRPAPSVRCR